MLHYVLHVAANSYSLVLGRQYTVANFCWMWDGSCWYPPLEAPEVERGFEMRELMDGAAGRMAFL